MPPRTRTEICTLCAAAREVFSHSAAPVPGPSIHMREIPDPVSWECRNTACARKERKKGTSKRAERSGACAQLSSCTCVWSSGPGLFFPCCKLVLHVGLTACPAISIRSRDCRNATRDMNQDVECLPRGPCERDDVLARLHLCASGGIGATRSGSRPCCLFPANACH